MWRKWKNILVSMFLSVLTATLLKQTNIIDYSIFMVNESNYDFYWNVINFNAIISGFMFTALGIIMGMSDGKIMQRLSATSIVDRMYLNVVFGIWAGIVSVCLALLVIISSSAMTNLLMNFIPFVITISIIFTLCCFVKSTNDIWYLITKTRKSTSNERMSLERRQAVYDWINEDNKKGSR